MKKLVTLAVGAAVLVAFTGLSAAQEKKPTTQAMCPPPDKLKLSSTQNAPIGKGCPVTAHPWVSPTCNVFPGITVQIVPPTAVLNPPSPWTTNAQGDAKGTVKSGQTVHAEIQGPKGTVTSSNFVCSSKYPTE